MSENKFYKQAREELAYLSGDPGFQRLVEARAGFLMDQSVMKAESYKEGKADGIVTGKADGRKERQLEIAQKMKSKNISVSEISELTGLSTEEIEKL